MQASLFDGGEFSFFGFDKRDCCAAQRASAGAMAYAGFILGRGIQVPEKSLDNNNVDPF